MVIVTFIVAIIIIIVAVTVFHGLGDCVGLGPHPFPMVWGEG